MCILFMYGYFSVHVYCTLDHVYESMCVQCSCMVTLVYMCTVHLIMCMRVCVYTVHVYDYFCAHVYCTLDHVCVLECVCTLFMCMITFVHMCTVHLIMCMRACCVYTVYLWLL